MNTKAGKASPACPHHPLPPTHSHLPLSLSPRCFNFVFSTSLFSRCKFTSIMGFKCAAVGCRSGYNPQETNAGVSFHKFPLNNVELLQVWLKKMQRKGYSPTESSRLCSLHFEDLWFTEVRKDSNNSRIRSKTSLLKRR